MKIPPIVQTFLATALAWGLARVAPIWHVESQALVIAAWVSVIVGMAFLCSALLHFRSQGTTIDPLNPEKAQSLVVSGVYKVTRNPMYVGLVWLLAAWCFYLGYVGAFLALPIFIFAMTQMQIKAEEHALQEKFGTEYANYMRRVRRWL